MSALCSALLAESPAHGSKMQAGWSHSSVESWCVAGRLDFEVQLGKHCAVFLALESICMCRRSVGNWW